MTRMTPDQQWWRYVLGAAQRRLAPGAAWGGSFNLPRPSPPFARALSGILPQSRPALVPGAQGGSNFTPGPGGGGCSEVYVGDDGQGNATYYDECTGQYRSVPVHQINPAAALDTSQVEDARGQPPVMIPPAAYRPRGGYDPASMTAPQPGPNPSQEQALQEWRKQQEEIRRRQEAGEPPVIPTP